MKKWFIGLTCVGMLATAATGALTSPATLPVEYAGANGWSNATLKAMTGWDATGLDKPYAAPNASSKFNSADDNIVIYFDSAPGEIVYSARRSDATAPTNTFEVKLQESVDNIAWTDVQTFDGSEFTGTLVTFTNALSSSSRYVKFIYTVKAGGQNFGVGYVKITTGGAAVFGVTFDKTSGFTVDEGTSATITATAVNGTPEYTYTWTTDLGATYRTISEGVLTILAAAPVGSYSASVVASDSASATASNSLTFSVAAPATKYGITVTAPVNGSVTTTPATQAEAGATVTINATPTSGYAVDTITAVDADMGSVTVTGTTFTMPAKAVTVTVTFKVSAVPDFTLDFSDLPTLAYADISTTANGLALDIAQCYREVKAPDYAIRTRWTSTNAGYFGNVDAFTNGSISKMSFQYKAYSATHTNYQFVVQFKTAGGEWTQAGDTYLASNIDWAEAEVLTVPSGSTYFRIQSVAPASGTIIKTGNFDNFGFWFGEASYGVTFDKTSGFTVETGSSATITATAANGAGPYNYVWTTTMGVGDYSTNSAVFTILATAPAGNFSASVVATDNTSAKVTNSISFSVVAPATKYGITVTAPVHGTVTTTPATEASAGATVTVDATPAGGYAVDSIVVNGGAVAVSGTTFTMPAQAVTVTVTFMEYTAPDALITFETGTLPSSYAANTAALEDGKDWSTMRVYKGNAENDKKIGTVSARLNPVTGTNAVLQQTQAYAEPITQLSFWVAAYGTDAMANVVLTAEVSPDGSTWEVVKTLTAATDITATLTEHVVSTIPANAVYVRFVASAQAASGKRINIDNVGIDFGAATMSVSVNKSNGFTVNEGSADSITATAANGTPEYAYSWVTTLPSGFSSAGAVFSILASAPVGNWSATVTATDDTAATAQKTVTFKVVGLNPGDPAVLISGNSFGTVGVEMVLTVTVTNETANDWNIDLTDPDSVTIGWTEDGFPPIWAFTPTKAGTYTLVVTAMTGSGNYSNTVNLMVATAAAHPPIAPITMVVDGDGDFQFELPDETEYRLVRVEGTIPSAFAGNVWTTLVEDTDYTISGTTLRILTIVPASRMIRIVLGSPQ